MNTRALKKQMKYRIPQLKLALIREPNSKTIPVVTPEDVEYFAEPLKHMPDFAPKPFMCPLLQYLRKQPVSM